MVMSEKLVNELGLKPIARMLSYAAQVDPRYMGIGPVAAIPIALNVLVCNKDIEQIELNEALRHNR